MDSEIVSIGLTVEERSFLMSLMISQPPSESEDGVIVGNDGIKKIPEDDYRRLWLSIDSKFRSS